jgi:hypothetical protein
LAAIAAPTIMTTVPPSTNSIANFPACNVIADSSDVPDYFMTRNNRTAYTVSVPLGHVCHRVVQGILQAPSHDVMLCKHIPKTNAACFNFDQKLAFAWRSQIGILNFQRSSLLLEYRVLVSPRKVHFEFGFVYNGEVNAVSFKGKVFLFFGLVSSGSSNQLERVMYCILSSPSSGSGSGSENDTSHGGLYQAKKCSYGIYVQQRCMGAPSF